MASVATIDAPFTPSLNENVARATEFLLRAFVHDWFAFFDRMDPDPTFGVAQLDPTDLRMEFPGTPLITTTADFASWYSAGLARNRRYAHHIQSITVTPSDERNAEIVDELVYQAELADGTFRSLRIRHEMKVRHTSGTNPRITTYRAMVV